jgi:hypothetical protein
LTGAGFTGYPDPVTFFQKHPKIHAAIHWLMSGVGFLLATQDQLLAATQLVPPGSKIPRFVGYALATLAFSKILLGRAQVAGGESASGIPTVETPASEAITVVEKNIDPKKSE